MTVEIFEKLESNVRSYCRHFPNVFSKAAGAILEDRSGKRYIDLLAGAGTLNYGHNNPTILEPVIRYLQDGGIVHSLDLHTEAKALFLETFEREILAPRGLRYKMQFPGPTGTNAVEAALKLARKVTGRRNVVAFTNGYHGMSLGALAATANPAKRAGAGVPLGNTTFLPYDGYLGPEIDTAELVSQLSQCKGGGVDAPAALIVETVQGEGGLWHCSPQWLRKISALAKDLGALLIVDDIQAGCGRTGTFFSFDEAGVVPDIVTLSKSLSGFGTPLALVLLKEEFDRWAPGEHNGTFRGNNLGFVGATAALNAYWTNGAFKADIGKKAFYLRSRLENIAAGFPAGAATIRGRGLFTGLAFADATIAQNLSQQLYRRGVIAETCGPNDEVLKFLPPLTIETGVLRTALDELEAIGAVSAAAA